MLAVGAHGLAETVVHEHPAAAGLPVQDAIDSLDARRTFGLVEAELHEIVHGAAGLRGAERVDELNVAGERVGHALVVRLGGAQEGRQIADRREAQAHDGGIARDVSELVERGRPERARSAEIARGQFDRIELRIDIIPIRCGHRDRLVRVVLPHRQARLRFVGARGRVVELLPGRGLPLVDDEFLGGRTGDRRAVRILGDRDIDREQLAGRRRDVPSAFQKDVALAHQESVARIAGGGHVIVGLAVVEEIERVGAAAVGDLVEQPAVSLGAVDRPQDLEIGRIGDGAVRVLGRQPDINDDGVAPVVGIDLAADLPADPLILPDRPEGGPPEGRGFHGLDHDPGHARVRGRRAAQEGDADQREAGGSPNTWMRAHAFPPDFFFACQDTPIASGCERGCGPSRAASRKAVKRLAGRGNILVRTPILEDRDREPAIRSSRWRMS